MNFAPMNKTSLITLTFTLLVSGLSSPALADSGGSPNLPPANVEVMDGDMVVRIRPGITFKASEPFLFSPSGKIALSLNEKGELVCMYAGSDVLWKAGMGAAYARYQSEDGNFCLYDKKDRFVWGTMIHGDHVKHGSIVLSSEGEVIQLDNEGRQVWKSEKKSPNP
jgi:hypothetical protein